MRKYCGDCAYGVRGCDPAMLKECRTNDEIATLKARVKELEAEKLATKKA